MITSLTKILSHFPGAANRARCTAHIVNLVTKIILRQFNARKKTKEFKKTPESLNANDESMEIDNEEDDILDTEGLDREEQEMADDEDDNGMSEDVEADVEKIEEALKKEVSDVAKKVKPIQRVLFKVR
jgi:hypothetical protein